MQYIINIVKFPSGEYTFDIFTNYPNYTSKKNTYYRIYNEDGINAIPNLPNYIVFHVKSFFR